MLQVRTQSQPISLLDQLVNDVNQSKQQKLSLLFCFSLDRLPEFEYYPIRVRGRFDHSREILIEPRMRLDQDATHGHRTGGHGAHVITPFRVANQK